MKNIGRKCLMALLLGVFSLLSHMYAQFPSTARASLPEKVWIEPVTNMEFVWIEGGCFQMGCVSGASECWDDENPVHQVCVDSFWIGKYEVTNKQYRMWQPEHNSKGWEGRSLNADDQPAVLVSWQEAKAFTAWLAEQNGNKYTFRLPTEAEWEYAARAGTTTDRPWGSIPNEACEYANVHDLTSKQVNQFPWPHHECHDGYAVTALVGSFYPNTFGLYDIIGNAWEWCEDWYDNRYYAQSSLENPHGPSSGNFRLLRGGGWNCTPLNCRSSSRLMYGPEDRHLDTGFRVVIESDLFVS